MAQIESNLIVGIDLGTTNSLIAAALDGNPVVLKDPNTQSALVPSVIHIDDSGISVGSDAKRLRLTDPKNTAYSVKRYIGRGKQDLTNEVLNLNDTSASTDQNIKIKLGSKEYTAIELSSLILKKLKSLGEQALGKSVQKAVITVPAYFNDSQRTATRAAGELAGLEVVRIVNEPTAAALAYGLDKKKNGIIAVYDLGGGTFDISILRLEGGIFEVLSTGGDTLLGGDDFDRAIFDEISNQVRKQIQDAQDLSSADLQTLLLETSENLKKALSEYEESQKEILWKNQKVKVSLNSSQLESLCEGLVAKTLKAVEQALKDAGIQKDKITDVVMVGGSTRMPLIRKKVESYFGQPLNTSLNPDEVVALGAAVQAQILSGAVQDMVLLDIVPLSLGIETYGGTVSKIILRNSKIPTVAKEAFTTHVDGQRNVLIHVLQGERELAQDCRSLARFNLQGIPPWPAGLARIEVTFLIDANGILKVKAQEMTSGLETEVDVRPSYGLTDEEVEKMLSDSIDFAEKDMTDRQVIDTRVQAEGVLRSADKILRDAKNYFTNGDLTEAIKTQIVTIESQIQKIKTLNEGRDYSLIRLELSLLENITKPIAAEVMNASLKRNLANKKVSDVLTKKD